MKRRLTFFILLVFVLVSKLLSQSKPSSEILESIKKLNVLGSVLYVAAHPDDENTRLITFLSKDQKLRTAYVSLTRGDGGQNLIGPQLDEFLGVIRTNELLEARKIDGGIQYFTRANDFGYSKNAEETLNIWNKDSLIYDLVRIIRDFKPDVIINRFDHRTSGKTHGHHTASAILANEAYRLAGSSLYRRDALNDLEPIIIPRNFFNTSIFFYGSKEKFDAADKSNLYSLNVGTYYTSSGLSNGEISSMSRSMHKSQGFGINSSRGNLMEYFERLDKEKEYGHVSPFDGLDLTWTRINGGGNVKKVIDQVIAEFNINDPSASIPLLQKAEKYIQDLTPGHWKNIKLAEIREVIYQCAGLYSEATTDRQITANGNKIKVNIEFISRGKQACNLQRCIIQPSSMDTVINLKLQENVSWNWSKEMEVKDIPLTSPFWLKYNRGNAFYQFDDITTINRPVMDHALMVQFDFSLNGVNYTLSKDIIYKNDDPVQGELRQPLDVLPEVTVDPFDPSVVLHSAKPITIQLSLRSRSVNQSGKLSLKLPLEVKCKPSSISYRFNLADETQNFEFELSSSKLNNSIHSIPILINNQQAYTHTMIKYSHIPWQNVLTPSVIKFSAVDLKFNPVSIAYINGAGDYIDEAMSKLGFKVVMLQPEKIGALDPKTTPVLVFGIRAWNTQEELTHQQDQLMKYIKDGGRVIFQYNTTAELLLGDFLGKEFKISRDRITNESSPVKIINPDHTLLNIPNKIDSTDFNFWVQERGLYFPNEYKEGWETLIALNDPNEKELYSGILYKKIGKGSVIYTPLSWFRQLPASVPGAYRLFVNLISTQHE